MKRVGQDFSDFMKEQGLYEKAQELASKKVIAAQLKAEMQRQELSKSEVAKLALCCRGLKSNILFPGGQEHRFKFTCKL